MYITFFLLAFHKTTTFLKLTLTENILIYSAKGCVYVGNSSYDKEKPGQSLLPTSRVNKNHKPRTNLIPFVLTQPICIISTHSIILHDTKKTNNWVLQKWRASQEYVQELLRAGLTRLSHGPVMSLVYTLPHQTSDLSCMQSHCRSA